MNSVLKRRIIKVEKGFYLFVTIVFIISCNGQKKMASKDNLKTPRHMKLVAHNSYSGADSTETMVITSAKALKLFYSRVNRTRKPGLPVPNIDFSKNMVLIHCSSDENYQIHKKPIIIKETDDELILGMSKGLKVDDDISTSPGEAMVSPFFVYTMPLTEKKVSVKKVE